MGGVGGGVVGEKLGCNVGALVGGGVGSATYILSISFAVGIYMSQSHEGLREHIGMPVSFEGLYAKHWHVNSVSCVHIAAHCSSVTLPTFISTPPSGQNVALLLNIP